MTGPTQNQLDAVTDDQAREVSCPACRALPRERCVTTSGVTYRSASGSVHRARKQAYLVSCTHGRRG